MTEVVNYTVAVFMALFFLVQLIRYREFSRRRRITKLSRDIWMLVRDENKLGVPFENWSEELTDCFGEIKEIFPEYELGYVYTFWYFDSFGTCPLYTDLFMFGETIPPSKPGIGVPPLSYSGYEYTKTMHPYALDRVD